MTRRVFLSALMAPAPYRLIDPHVHVWQTDPRFPFVAGAKPPSYDAPPERLLELMKQHGVQKTVIIQVRHYMFDNRYLAHVLREYPQYFQGVARVNPLDPAAPDHLSRLTEEDKMRGVRLSPAADASGDWLRGDLMSPLWQRCRDLKVPMTLLAPVSRMPDAQKLIEKYPDLTVVIDHMADTPVNQPQELDRLLALARYPKVFVKISHTWSLSKEKYPWRDTHEHVKRLHQAFGPQRLMWATDWPICDEHRGSYGQSLSVVRDEMKFLNDEDKQWMLSRTIERVWPFG